MKRRRGKEKGREEERGEEKGYKCTVYYINLGKILLFFHNWNSQLYTKHKSTRNNTLAATPFSLGSSKPSCGISVSPLKLMTPSGLFTPQAECLHTYQDGKWKPLFVVFY